MATSDPIPPTGDVVRQVARLTDLLESLDVRISEMDQAVGSEHLRDGYVTVSLTVGVPLEADLPTAGPRQGERETPEATDESEQDSGGFECDECGRTFDSEKGRAIHAGRVHPDEDAEEGSTPREQVVAELLEQTSEGVVEQTASDLAEACDLSGQQVGGVLRTLDDDRLTIEKESRMHDPAIWHVARGDAFAPEPPGDLPDDLTPAVTPVAGDTDETDAPAATTDGGVTTVSQSATSRESKPDLLRSIRDHVGLPEHKRDANNGRPTKTDLRAVCQHLNVGDAKIAILEKDELSDLIRDTLSLDQTGTFHKTDLQALRDALVEQTTPASQKDYTPVWKRGPGGEP